MFKLTGKQLIHGRWYRYVSRRFVKTWSLSSIAVLFVYLKPMRVLIGEYVPFCYLMDTDNNIIV